METVNLRSKKTATEAQVVLSIWEERRGRVQVRKSYEGMIEEDNKKIQKAVKEILEPVCVATDTPIEFIIEANRCIVQTRLYSSPKAKGAYFVTNVSQNIPSLHFFMKDSKALASLAPTVKKAIRRIRAITKKELGKTLGPIEKNPITRIQDMKRKPDEPMIMVSYNIRTRYDF